MIVQKIKNDIIKLLGGYTPKEYRRVEQKYQALLDSKTDTTCAQLVNEYMFRTFRDLIQYAKNELWGNPSDEWACRMFNVLRNNMFRILIRYLNHKSSIIYKLDTTLDAPDAFKRIIESDKDTDSLKYFDNDNIDI